MNIADLDILGYYNPGFLHLRVNTTDELKDLNKLAADSKTAPYFSIFLHEYIHFLQDITTPNGLIMTVHMIDVLKEFIYEVRSDAKSEFKTPLALSNPSNMDANNRLQAIYRGGADPVLFAEYIRFEQEHEPLADKDGNIFNVAKYRVYYYPRVGPLTSFYFGTTCIKEFVTHTLQTQYAPETVHEDIPYQIAGKIIEKEFPALIDKPLMMVALCDASLLSLHPAQMFFNLINAMKHQDFVPGTPMDVFNFMHDNFKFNGPSGEFDLDGLIDHQVVLAVKQMDNALKSTIFEPNNRWIRHLLFEAYMLRKDIPDFMTRLVDGERNLSPLFYAIFHRIGTPFLTNENGLGGFVPPRTLDASDVQPFQLLVFREIINIFGGQRFCGMFDFCKSHSEKDITNELCLTAPWLRGIEDNLCPFGQFWKTWGLNGEVPVQ